MFFLLVILGRRGLMAKESLEALGFDGEEKQNAQVEEKKKGAS